MRLSNLINIVHFLAAYTFASGLEDFPTISLRNIRSLQLKAGEKTVGKSPIDQLICCGGSAHGLYDISEMTCENIAGKDDYGVEELNWRCTAQLPEEFVLGSTDVSCEFRSDQDTDEVLMGSCSVSYKLMLTKLGEERFPNHQPPEEDGSLVKDKNWIDVIFWACFTSVAAYIVYSIFRDTRTRAPRDARPLPRHRVNDGGFDDDDHGDDGDEPGHHSTTFHSSETQGESRSNSWLPLALGGGVASAAILGRNAQPRAQSPSTIIRTDTSRASSISQPSTPSFSYDTSRSSSGFGGTGRR